VRLGEEKLSRRPATLAILALLVAPAAFAHNRFELAVPSLDLRHVESAPIETRALAFFNANTFEELTRIECPRPSVAEQLDERISVRLSVFAVKPELASGVFRLRGGTNVKRASELSGKPWWGRAYGALPFVEPATGLIYARARWYDPQTGTFLTPDPSGYADSSNLYAYAAGDPVNNSDPTGECIGLDDIACSQYAMDISDQFNNPRHWWGNAKRSARFLAFEVRGAALAVPRAANAVYDVATHLPETVQAAKNLAIAAANDPVGMLTMAGNAIINAEPDAVAEFTGETLFFAGLGAAAKTPQGAAALRNLAPAKLLHRFTPDFDLRLGADDAALLLDDLVPSFHAERIGYRNLPNLDNPWVKYQRHVTGRNYEDAWRLGGHDVFPDTRRMSYTVEAKWAGRNTAAWARSPYNPVSRFYDEAGILKQARSLLELDRASYGRGVRYAISNDPGRLHFERLFQRHFPEAMRSGRLRVFHVPGTGMR
jgi:RHS repeat-associated protein